MDEQKKTNTSFSDYIYILYKWRKFLIINIFIVTSLATLYAFLLPKEYKATTVVMVPPENSMLGLGGLTGLIGGKSSSSNIGAKLLGVSKGDEDILLGILNSRTALTNVIVKFDLIKYYEINDKNIDKALRVFTDDISFEPNEFGMIEITVANRDPQKSAEIANYFVRILDSTNIALNIEQATNNRKFIEQRYLKNISDLRKAEDSLSMFQKKYGVFAVPEQLEVAVKAAGEIEAQLTNKELESYFIKQIYGDNSPQMMGLKTQIEMLKTKVVEINKADKLSSVSNILFPFKEAPEMTIHYLRYYREVEIQSKILEYVLPLYEQTKVEEQKSIPTIAIIDKAIPPILKDSPKRAFIILAFFFIALFIHMPFVFRGEKTLKSTDFQNPIEQKEYSFFKKIVAFYRIRL